MDIKQTAKKYLQAGYSVFPVKEDKTPCVDWGKYSVERMKEEEVNYFFNIPTAKGVALVTGFNSVTCIDIDSKYDLSGRLYEDLVSQIPPDIFSKLAVNKTMSGGYHLLFQCTKCEGSTKLASRNTTREEKLRTLDEALSSGEEIDAALRQSLGDKNRILIETRGVGGYCLIPPSPGYSRIGGKIGSITVEEYDILFEICRSFNTYIRPVANFVSRGGTSLGGENIFANINKEFDVLSYLDKNGWKSVGQTSQGWHKIKRPGKTTNPHSAYFDPDKNIFWCFSTSSGFELNKSYSAVDLLLYFDYDDNKEMLPELRKKFMRDEN